MALKKIPSSSFLLFKHYLVINEKHKENRFIKLLREMVLFFSMHCLDLPNSNIFIFRDGIGQPWPKNNLASRCSLALKDVGLCSEVLPLSIPKHSERHRIAGPSWQAAPPSCQPGQWSAHAAVSPVTAVSAQDTADTGSSGTGRKRKGGGADNLMRERWKISIQGRTKGGQ